MAKRWTIFVFTFSDGYRECARNYNALDRAEMIAKHGLIVGKEKA